MSATDDSAPLQAVQHRVILNDLGRASSAMTSAAREADLIGMGVLAADIRLAQRYVDEALRFAQERLQP